MTKKHLQLLLWLTLALTACLRAPELGPQGSEQADSTVLVVPEGFDFRMQYQQAIALRALDEAGQPMYRIRYYLFTAPPEEGGKVIATGLTDKQGYFRTSVQVSTAQKALYAYTPYLDLVRAQRLELTGEPIEHTWGLAPYPAAGQSYKTAIDTTFGCDPSFYQVLGSRMAKLDVVSGTYMTLGSASSNYNGVGYNHEDGMIYGFQKSGGDINLWRINPNGIETDLGQIIEQNSNYSSGNYKGDFDLDGYLYSVYNSGGEIHLGRLDVDNLPYLGEDFQLSNLNGANGNIHDIAYNETHDHFYTVNKDGHILIIDHNSLTIEDVGNYRSTVGTGPFGAVWCISTGEVFFSQNNTGNIYRADLDANGLPTNVALQLVGEANGNNDGAGCVGAESPFNDIDGDGIPNGNDDYPEDGVVAYATYTPSQVSYGSYAFEDFWPKRGDYDFNDLVIDYNYEVARDTANQVHWAILNFRLRALGAGFKAGFGIQFDDLVPGQVASVSGTTTATTALEANGCESGQSAAVIMVTDNAHGNFGVPVGHLVNTGQEGTATRDPVYLQVKVAFTNPIPDLGTINPFITTRGDRGYEIHLMGHQPTDLVNQDLFDTEGDDSSSGTYYVDTYGFPWGMDFPVQFDYPREKVVIRSSYPQFDTWVSTRGAEQADWYLRSKAIIDRVVIQ